MAKYVQINLYLLDYISTAAAATSTQKKWTQIKRKGCLVVLRR